MALPLPDRRGPALALRAHHPAGADAPGPAPRQRPRGERPGAEGMAAAGVAPDRPGTPPGGAGRPRQE
jgi:hypothetical protein